MYPELSKSTGTLIFVFVVTGTGSLANSQKQYFFRIVDLGSMVFA